jgi:hypothetical protein
MSALVVLALVALVFIYTSMGRTLVLLFGTIALMLFVYWVG